MTSSPPKHSARTGPVNTAAQVGGTHKPLFPFSSPDIDHRLTLRSDQSEFTIRPRDGLEPPSSSNIVIVDNIKQDQRAFHHSGVLQAKTRGTTADTSVDARKRPRPGLHVVTNFSPPTLRSGNVVLNKVAVKQPEEQYSRARSVVSQKGLKGLPSPLVTGETQVIAILRDLINRNREKKAASSSKQGQIQNLNPRTAEHPSTRKSLMFGLSVPEHESGLHRHDEFIHSAVTLVTPGTPRIVVTPAHEEEHFKFTKQPHEVQIEKKLSSPTSVYSKSASEYHQPDINKLPQLSQGSQNILRNNSRTERRHSTESQQQILPESCDTARPKSQGWWNLMLSPILSRAGTLKAKRVLDQVEIPPVPPIPATTEKSLSMQTPLTNMSPVTPRRTGLAKTRTSTWSRWSEWEDDRDFVDDDVASIDEAIPAAPHDPLTTRSTHDIRQAIPEAQGEGLAAEYYHACAVEQLANVTYFECVNHSCADHLPKLQSIFDTRATDTTSSSHGLSAQSPERDIVMQSHQKSSGRTDSTIPSSVTGPDNGIGLSGIESHLQKHGPVSPIGNNLEVQDLVSPNLREDSTAAFSKAGAVDTTEQPTGTLTTTKKVVNKRIDTDLVSIMSHQLVVESPGPISPEATRAIAPTGAMPLAPIQSQPADTTVALVAPVPQANHALLPSYQPPPTFIYYPHGQTGPYQFFMPPPQQSSANHQMPAHLMVQSAQLEPRSGTNAEASSDATERAEGHMGGPVTESTKVETKTTETNKVKKKRNFWGVLSSFGRSKPKRPSSRRRTIVIASILMIIVVLCILFAILFTRGHGEATPIASQWLNLSGYPPMPTGISTIAQPNLAASQTQCTTSKTLWSCSLPKEDQAAVSPNQPNQPNFRFQMRFHNGTVPANLTIPLGRRSDDSSADGLFVPNPTPPGLPDQKFLGNTTDNVTKPFEGESTPFFITFLSALTDSSVPSGSSKRLTVRQSDSDFLDAIPPPAIGSDGLAAPASLLPTTPLPISQPVRLYNRGLSDEHYGFYMYFDKSIFLSAFSIQNGTAVQNNQSLSDADQNGGCTKQAANIRCTWSQTRFVVKMYTNPAFGGRVLAGPPTNKTSGKQNNNTTSSATDFSRPGSFPYPTSILLDRHGGDVNKKLVYCYGMENESIISDQKILVSEFRSFGGVAVNPAPIVLNAGNTTLNSDFGGIDGGSGGCGCTWQNWT